MRKRRQLIVSISIAGVIMCILSIVTPVFVEAALRSHTVIRGTVVAADHGIWYPFTPETALEAGDSIRTGSNSAVTLQGADGSVLYLEENTQLTVNELTFSQIDHARIFRFTLLQGKLTAKAVQLDAKVNIFEVKTSSVNVGFQPGEDSEQEASVTIIARSSDIPYPLISAAFPLNGNSDSQGFAEESVIDSFPSYPLLSRTLPPIGSTGSLGRSEDPFASRVLPLSGKFDLKQISHERTEIEVNVGSGILISISKPGQTLDVGVNGKNITLESNQPLDSVSLVTDSDDNAVDIENSTENEEAELGLNAGNNTLSMGAGSALNLTAPLDAAGNEFSLVIPDLGVSISFTFSSDPSAIGEIRITALTPGIQVNGTPLTQGESTTVTPPPQQGDTGTSAGTNRPAENPVSPPAASSSSTGPGTGAGSGGGESTPSAVPTLPPEQEGSKILP